MLADELGLIKGARLLKPPFSRGGYSGSDPRRARHPEGICCPIQRKLRSSGRGGFLTYHLLRRLGRVGAIDLALRLTTCVTIFAIACVVDIGDTEIYDSLALPR